MTYQSVLTGKSSSIPYSESSFLQILQNWKIEDTEVAKAHR